jgi:hypothetical protein
MKRDHNKPISSQAKGNANSTLEGSETRGVTSVTNNRLQECPASLQDDDIVRYSSESRRGCINDNPACAASKPQISSTIGN